VFVNGVKLSALNGIEEDFGCFLYTFEEAIIFGATGSCLLVRMVTENLLSVGTLDLIFGGFVAVFRETKNGIMILAL
jgi:hypothetical protein